MLINFVFNGRLKTSSISSLSSDFYCELCANVLDRCTWNYQHYQLSMIIIVRSFDRLCVLHFERNAECTTWFYKDVCFVFIFLILRKTLLPEISLRCIKKCSTFRERKFHLQGPFFDFPSGFRYNRENPGKNVEISFDFLLWSS